MSDYGIPKGSDTLLERAQRDALASQLADLDGQVTEYERLKSGSCRIFEVKDLSELPLALIRARIARGLTQADLAQSMGLHMQQIQQYEANDYSNASFSRMKQVASSLGVAVASDVFVPDDLSGKALLKKLQGIGLDRTFIERRLTPISAGGRLEDVQNAQDLMRSARFASKALEIPVSELLTQSNPQPRLASLASVRHKLPKGADAKKVSFYTVYAHYLGLLTLEATSRLSRTRTPENTDELHDAIVRAYGVFSFRATVCYVWDHLGIPVLPLRLHGGFHGATWRVRGRDVIVLNPGQSFPAFWLNDLLHEVGHTGQDPEDSERTIVEFDPIWESTDKSDDEVDARLYAIDTIFRSRAEALTKLVETSAKSVEGLKRAVEQVSTNQGVLVDSLALVIAAQYKETSWWGTAINLQDRSVDAFEVCRDEFLVRVDLSVLSPDDREMLLLGLQGDEE